MTDANLDPARTPHPAPAHARAYRSRAVGSGHSTVERGSASIQLVVLMPVMFSVMFLGVQAALYYHAREVAIAAAHEGAREAGSQSGTRESGMQIAAEFIAQAGGTDVLEATNVTASRSTTFATVTVRGESLSVIPGWKPSVTQSSSVPVERLTS